MPGLFLHKDHSLVVGYKDFIIKKAKSDAASYRASVMADAVKKEAELEKDFDIRKEEAKRTLGERLLKEDENLKNSALHNIPQAVEKISELILQ